MPSRMPLDRLVTASGVRTFSKLLVVAYVLDWVAVVVIAGIAGGLSRVTPHYRAFSPIDLSISFPYVDETVPIVALVFIAGIIPALIIFAVVLVFVPGPKSWRSMSKADLFRWKMWEWNVGWLGLAMSHAISQLLVQGVKNMAGKPRPNALARCAPDLTNIADHRVGGYGQDISPSWILVDQTACTETDKSTIEDAFRSFPSGHATASWVGMLYLSLFLASKFSIWYPQLPLAGGQGNPYYLQRKEGQQLYRDEGAAPPTWLLYLILVPLGIAVYVTGSRYLDYYHFGIDLICGAVIGILVSLFSFRLYNPPLGRSLGWAWGPRSKDRALLIGVGTYGWVDEDSTAAAISTDKSKAVTRDIEAGTVNGSQQAPQVPQVPQTQPVQNGWS